MPSETYIINLDKVLRIEQNLRQSIHKKKSETLKINSETGWLLFQGIEKELLERQEVIAE